MDFLITRRASYASPEKKATMGDLTISGDDFHCYTLEPPTPIPLGRYEVLLTLSGESERGILWTPRADHVLPLLDAVPGHEGIRIHSGNTAHDTKDCILVGVVRGVDCLSSSRTALIAVMAKLDAAQAAAERSFVTIVEAP